MANATGTPITRKPMKVKESRVSAMPVPPWLRNRAMMCSIENSAIRTPEEGRGHVLPATVHLGGVSVERSFEEILPANIQGVYHVYEAARLHGVRRVVFASSNHVIGFYEQGAQLDADVPLRPDGYYGLSKAYGENLSRFYYDRYGIETVCLRIGSSFPEPRDRRMMVTWLSYDDLTDLVVRSLFTPNVGHLIAYGASANRDSWWDNHGAAALGFAPGDSSEIFRAQVEAQPPLAADDPAARYQGGAFVKAGPFPFPPR